MALIPGSVSKRHWSGTLPKRVQYVLNDPVMNPDPTHLKIMQQKFMLILIKYKYKILLKNWYLSNPLWLTLLVGSGGFRMFRNLGFLIRVRFWYVVIRIRNTAEKSVPCRLLRRLWFTPASGSVEAEPRLWRPLRESGRYLWALARRDWQHAQAICEPTRVVVMLFFAIIQFFLKLHITKAHRLTLALNCRSEF